MQSVLSGQFKIVLKAEAGDNYKLDRWNGCDKVSDGQCQTTLNKSKMIVAKFVSTRAIFSQKSSKTSKSFSASSKTSSSKSSLSSKSNSSVSFKQTQKYKTLTINNVFITKEKALLRLETKYAMFLNVFLNTTQIRVWNCEQSRTMALV